MLKAEVRGLGGRLAVVDVPDRILQLLGRVFRRELVDEAEIVVHGARDDVEIEPLRRARLLDT